MARPLIRLAALALVAAPAVLGTASPVSAAERTLSRSTDFFGTAYFLQEEATAGNGNVHLGQVFAEETSIGRARISGFIEDYACPAGVYPDLLDQGNGCTAVGTQLLEGADVPFSVARRASSARLLGSLTARTGDLPGISEDEGGTALADVAVDITWTATSAPKRIRSTFRFEDPETGSVTTTKTTTTRRLTTLRGRLGPVVLDGAREADGTLEAVRTTSRFRA